MSTHERLSILQVKYDYLDCQIRQEMNRPLPSCELLRDLKKRKFRLKEEMLALMV